MFNPKAYLEQFLVKKLETWIDNFNGTSLNIGLWESDINLSDLVLKHQTLKLSNDLIVELEYGHVELLSLQVPWSTIRVGGIHANLNGINLVFRLQKKSDSDAAESSKLQRQQHYSDKGIEMQDDVCFLNLS
jgi:hypothetical protein